MSKREVTSRTQQSRLHDPMLRARSGMRDASDNDDESNLDNHGGAVAAHAAQSRGFHRRHHHLLTYLADVYTLLPISETWSETDFAVHAWMYSKLQKGEGLC